MLRVATTSNTTEHTRSSEDKTMPNTRTLEGFITVLNFSTQAGQFRLKGSY
jgi:hypothetical protein